MPGTSLRHFWSGHCRHRSPLFCELYRLDSNLDKTELQRRQAMERRAGEIDYSAVMDQLFRWPPIRYKDYNTMPWIILQRDSKPRAERIKPGRRRELVRIEFLSVSHQPAPVRLPIP